MRTVEQKIFNALGPLVANRVHPVVIPQGVTFPCIRYALVTATPENSLCGSSGLVRSQVQVDVYAADYSGALALREQVTAAMRAFPLACILTLEAEGFEPDERVFRRTLQYSLAEQEGAAP